ncbi:DUF1501 domain-containing protein [Nocardioides sp.]|uniref:DUF1501 domain-containing protein n=1 Tax=Nocardioides sp. TaxID=35761 RepID=UPI0037852E57
MDTPAAPGTGPVRDCGCPEFEGFRLSRRRLLGAMAAGGALATAGMYSGAYRQVAYGAEPGGNVLVVLSMRGGADGLSIVVPRSTEYDLLAGYRPSIVVPEGQLWGDDPRFGFHPALKAGLEDLWTAGSFGAVHAVGLPESNMSHFDAMVEIEEATPGSDQRVGWINRMVGLDAANGPETAVEIGDAMLPTSLMGPANALAAYGVADLSVRSLGTAGERAEALKAMWKDDPRLLGGSVRTAMKALDTFAPLVAAADSDPSEVHRDLYPGYAGYDDWGPLKDVLANTAALIRADLGTSMITIDYGDWDMHVGLSDGSLDPGTDWMAAQLDHLGGSLKAFFADLGAHAGRVTVVTMSEFGRRVDENGDHGLDHGYGNVMLLLGAGVAKGVHGSFPGLTTLDPDNNLIADKDFRDILWEVTTARLGISESDRTTVFPGLGPVTPIGLMT